MTTKRDLLLPPPPEAVLQGRPELAEYVLRIVHVALITGYNKQSVHDWVRTGRRGRNGQVTALPTFQSEGRKSVLRFRLADVEAFAAEQGIQFDLGQLPPIVQLQLGLEGVDTDPDEEVGETVVAALTGIPPATLRKRREANALPAPLEASGVPARYRMAGVLGYLQAG